MMEKKPKFKAIDQAIYSKGFVIVFLTRLSPIMPYGLCNYLFGVKNKNKFLFKIEITNNEKKGYKYWIFKI